MVTHWLTQTVLWVLICTPRGRGRKSGRRFEGQGRFAKVSMEAGAPARDR